MKIHVKKDRTEKTGLFGGDKSYYTVIAHFELNDEEKRLLSKNRHVLKLIAVEFPYTAPNGKYSEYYPTVENMIDERSFAKQVGYNLGCVFTNAELQELEDMINQAARSIKAELYGGETGKSVYEI